MIHAGGKGGELDRFPIMAEISPWTSQDALSEALIYRGAILAGWGNVETWLNDLAIRCSHTDAYCQLAERYPFRLSSRMSFLRRVLATPGPLTPYHGLGEAFLQRFEASAAVRHTMAHARMRVLTGTIRFDEITLVKGEIEHRWFGYSPEQLRRLALRASRLSRIAQRASDIVDAIPAMPRSQQHAGPV